MFQALLWQKAYVQNVRFETLYGINSVDGTKLLYHPTDK